MVTFADIQSAQQRISGSIINTPVIQDEYKPGHNVFLKLDNLQVTGSFKERGALNKLKLLLESKKYKGVIGASAGNHAQAVAYHGARLGFSVSMIMPKHTPIAKANATQKWGAHIVLEGDTVDEGTKHAREIAKEKGWAFVHPFDDTEIIAGQGTMALELIDKVKELDCMVIPVGGGGLASGMAIAIKTLLPKCKVIGVQTEKYPQIAMAYHGKDPKKVPTDIVATIADGIAVKGSGEFTLPLLKKYVDDIITVSDEDIADAISYLLQKRKVLAEGAGAAGLAAILSGKVKVSSNEKIATTICGGNIDMNLLSRIIEQGFLKNKRLLKVNVIISDRPGSLHKLTGVLAQNNVNVLQIEHDRVSTSIPYYNTGTNLLLEVRGEEHYDQTVAALQDHCVQVKVLS